MRAQHLFYTCHVVLLECKNEDDCFERMKGMLLQLPAPNYTLISWLMVHLSEVIENVRRALVWSVLSGRLGGGE